MEHDDNRSENFEEFFWVFFSGSLVAEFVPVFSGIAVPHGDSIVSRRVRWRLRARGRCVLSVDIGMILPVWANRVMDVMRLLYPAISYLYAGSFPNHRAPTSAKAAQGMAGGPRGRPTIADVCKKFCRTSVHPRGCTLAAAMSAQKLPPHLVSAGGDDKKKGSECGQEFTLDAQPSLSRAFVEHVKTAHPPKRKNAKTNGDVGKANV